jgi:hypothetical protein
MDDLDSALQAGLLTIDVCADCSAACRARLLLARDARRAALEARERFRQRETRLARKRHERDQRRVSAPSSAPGVTTPIVSLPPAAAAALARARLRAAGRDKP